MSQRQNVFGYVVCGAESQWHTETREDTSCVVTCDDAEVWPINIPEQEVTECLRMYFAGRMKRSWLLVILAILCFFLAWTTTGVTVNDQVPTDMLLMGIITGGLGGLFLFLGIRRRVMRVAALRMIEKPDTSLPDVRRNCLLGKGSRLLADALSDSPASKSVVIPKLAQESSFVPPGGITPRMSVMRERTSISIVGVLLEKNSDEVRKLPEPWRPLVLKKCDINNETA